MVKYAPNSIFHGLSKMRFLLSVLVVCLLNSCHDNSIPIVANGSTEYYIYLPKGSHPVGNYSATLFQSTVKEMTNVTLEIKHELVGQSKPILISTIEELPNDFIEIKPRDLQDNEFRILNNEEYLLITGGSTSATRNAVVSVLSDFWGCRWYTPDFSVIPKTSVLTFPEIQISYKPTFDYRDLYYPSNFDAEWSILNRTTPAHIDIPDCIGTKYNIFPFTHSLARLVEPTKHFDKHPEYFALVNGVRTWEDAQLCLTNPAIVDIAEHTINNWLEYDSTINYVAIDQEDLANWCTCSNCLAITKSSGTESTNLLNFVNSVAHRFSSTHPELKFTTLGYLESERPGDVFASPNVSIRLCRMGYCDAHQVDQCQHRQSFVNKYQGNFTEHLESWNRVSQEVFIWDYYVDFSNYLLPYPNWASFYGNVPYYARNEVKGIFAQGSGRDESDFAEMRAWVMAQLLWDPSLKPATLMEEFVNAYYGEAAPYIFDYLHLSSSLMSNDNAYLIAYSGSSYLPNAFLLRSEEIFAESMSHAKSTIVLERVQKQQLFILYAQLLKYSEHTLFAEVSNRSYEDVFTEFNTLVKKFSIKRFRERKGNIADMLDQFRKLLPVG